MIESTRPYTPQIQGILKKQVKGYVAVPLDMALDMSWYYVKMGTFEATIVDLARRFPKVPVETIIGLVRA